MFSVKCWKTHCLIVTVNYIVILSYSTDDLISTFTVIGLFRVLYVVLAPVMVPMGCEIADNCGEGDIVKEWEGEYQTNKLI